MSGVEENAELKGFDSYEFKLGDELRGERATLGRSLLDVQRHLRIKAAYIAAIEDCDPDVFPNKGFVAGYVRSYARYLGLDSEEVFARFCHESGFSGVNAGMSPKREPGAKTEVISSASAPDLSFASLTANAAAAPGRFSEMSFSAIGSLAVLVALILGLGYGGLQVVERLQRVEIAPLDQRPGALSEMAEIAAPGLGTEQVLPELQADARTSRRDQDLRRLYQPRELDVPVVTSRDGPILEIDPQSSGQFALASEADDTMVDVDAGLQQAVAQQGPVVRETLVAPNVRVAAQIPAWIRVSDADGTVVFEKILEKGEAYEVPEDIAAPILRSGNSGYVFVIVEDSVFGPIGQGTGVAKNISLLADDVRSAMPALEEIPEALQPTISASADVE